MKNKKKLSQREMVNRIVGRISIIIGSIILFFLLLALAILKGINNSING